MICPLNASSNGPRVPRHKSQPATLHPEASIILGEDQEEYRLKLLLVDDGPVTVTSKDGCPASNLEIVNESYS